MKRTRKDVNLKVLVLVNAAVLGLFLLHIAVTAPAQSTRHRPNSPEGADTRVYSPDIASEFPYVAKLYVAFSNGSLRPRGTGVFVSPNMVFTAAHVVFDRQYGGMATRVVIKPGYDRGTAPFGSTEASVISVPDEYALREDQNYDFAAIVTTTSLGDSCHWLSYKTPTIEDLNQVTIVGYPSDIGRGEVMVKSSSRALWSNSNEIQYKADTFEGMSGAPIINRHNQVIGIHTRADKHFKSNFGTRFMSDFLKELL